MVSVPDAFPGAPRQLTYPAAGAIAVTPSASPLAFVSRGLWVATTGDLTVIMQGDTTATPVTFANVQGGSLLPLRVTHVTTATTAGGIVAVQ